MPAKRGRVAGVPKAEPWKPSDYNVADVAAVQAVAYGRATEDQQRHAFKYMVEMLCGTYDLSYRSANPYDTSFAEGKRFVGLQLVKLADPKTLQLMRRKPSEQGESKPEKT
jgi:hypothetical protein